MTSFFSRSRAWSHRPSTALLALLVWAGTVCGVGLAQRARGASPALSDTYQKMVETDPYDVYALRRLLEVNKAPGSVNRLLDGYLGRVEARTDDRVAWALIGQLRRAADDPSGAVEAFERVAELSPSDARPWRAIAEVWRRARRWEPMLRAYQSALDLTTQRDLKGPLYEEATEAALDAERADQALGWLAEYRASAPRSGIIAMNSAELLSRFGKTEPALEAWRYAEQQSRTQRSQKVVIWRHLGTLLEEMGQLDEAEIVWRKAMKKTPVKHWSQAVFLEGLVRVFRRTDRLSRLAGELSERALKERHLQGTLAGLYDELGQPQAALAWLTRSIKHNKRDAGLHQRRIEILRRRDDRVGLDRAYVELIRSAPREARYGLEYAEELFRRGLVTQGLKRLDRVTATSRRDPGVWQRAISLMIRHAKGSTGSRLRKAYQMLIKLEPREPAHPIGLGEVLWESGDKAGAQASWRRLVSLGRGLGSGDLLLAEVLADHGLNSAASVAFDTALSKGPKNVACIEGAARWFGARSSSKDRERAMELWTRLLDLGLDAQAHPRAAVRRRSARKQLVDLWERARVLESRLRTLAQHVEAHVGDLSSGLLLTELRLHLGRTAEAESGLRSLSRRFPEHLEILRLRVTLALRNQELPTAISLLRQIASLDPRRAGEALHQAAEIAKALEDNEAALALTEEALRLHPEDAQSQVRVGEMRLGLGDPEKAAGAWREALRMNPRDDELRVKLAALYRELGDPLREERLLIELVRDASSNGQVQRAGRRLLRLGVAQGRLAPVERVLRPLASGQGRRSVVHRRLLVDLYLKQAQALTWELSRESDIDERLLQLGSRALEILLFAINGSDAALRSQALTVLRLTRPVGAVPSLSRMLEHGDGVSRLHAAVTLGFIGSDASADALGRTLEATTTHARVGPGKADLRELHYAAIWSLGRVGGDAAREHLLKLTSSEHAAHHPMVALALAHHSHSDTVRVLTQMTHRVGTRARQAALWSLAHLERDDVLPPLARALRSNHASDIEIALWGLGRADTDASRRILFDALMERSGPAPHLIVRALTSRPVSDRPSKKRDPYARLIDLDQLRLTRGVPDPNALISATVLDTPIASTPDRSLRFLESLDERYLRIGEGDDVALTRHALAPLMERAGLQLPDSWNLTGLAASEKAHWAHRLASRLKPNLERSVRSMRSSEDSLLAVDGLVRLVGTEPDPELSGALLVAIERFLSEPEARHGARAWRAASELHPSQLSRLVRSHGPGSRSLAHTKEHDEEWAAFAAAAGRCPAAQAQLELGPMLRSPSARVRLAAAQSVTPEHLELTVLLVDLLEDPAVEVARQAARSLSRFDAEEASDALFRIQDWGDPRSLLAN
jgi:tetratricopeptide (TPR) repeat protein